MTFLTATFTVFFLVFVNVAFAVDDCDSCPFGNRVSKGNTPAKNGCGAAWQTVSWSGMIHIKFLIFFNHPQQFLDTINLNSTVWVIICLGKVKLNPAQSPMIMFW